MGFEFGLFYEIPVATPWHARSEYDAYHNVIAQAVRGDEVGFSHFWTVEHHFLSEFSHCSAPEVLYGAVAAKTKRIKIGHGVRLLPFPYNHPIRVAEMGAALDIICDGRMEFGTGRSSTRDELEGFGIDPMETRELWQEALEVVIGAWTTDVFEWKGKYFKVPPRRVSAPVPDEPARHRARQGDALDRAVRAARDSGFSIERCLSNEQLAQGRKPVDDEVRL